MEEVKYPKEVKLKGGNEVTLRPLKREDEKGLLEFFRGLPQESTQFLKEDVRDAKVVQSFAERAGAPGVWALLALTKDGKVIADATLHVDQYGWRRHLGEIRVVVDPSFQKQGLATMLIHELVEEANRRGLSKLEAQVLESQAYAQAAFERMGFTQEAKLKEHAVAVDGSLHDLLILTNSVEDLWRTMEDLIMELEVKRPIESY